VAGRNGDWLGTMLCLSPFFPAAQPFPHAHIHAGRFSGIAKPASYKKEEVKRIFYGDARIFF